MKHKSSITDRFWSNVTCDVGCWKWNGRSTIEGYGLLKHLGKAILAHRMSYSIHYGSIPDGMCVCHSCDNPSCVNPAHLFVGTIGDNNFDRKVKGRYLGEWNGRAKLTPEQVIEIRSRPRSESIRSLAKCYGIHEKTLRQILRRETWAHLK